MKVRDRVIVSKIGEGHGVSLGPHNSGTIIRIIIPNKAFEVEYVDKGGYVKRKTVLKEFIELEEPNAIIELKGLLR